VTLGFFGTYSIPQDLLRLVGSVCLQLFGFSPWLTLQREAREKGLARVDTSTNFATLPAYLSYAKPLTGKLNQTLRYAGRVSRTDGRRGTVKARSMVQDVHQGVLRGSRFLFSREEVSNV
jgi:hypothetical protein